MKGKLGTKMHLVSRSKRTPISLPQKRELAYHIRDVLGIQDVIEDIEKRIKLRTEAEFQWAINKLKSPSTENKKGVAYWTMKDKTEKIFSPQYKKIKQPKNFLWESMFGMAQPNHNKLDYATLTAEGFLNYYLERQRRKGKKEYIEIVEKNRKKALEISEQVIERRKNKQLEKMGLEHRVRQFEFSKSPDNYYVDAGTINNGIRGKQKTRIACLDDKDKIVFDIDIGDKTNNEGEITAIVLALQTSELKERSIKVYSDSKIAVGWCKKGKTKKAPHAEGLAKKANELLLNTKSEVVWVPRQQNKAGVYLETKYRI